MAKTTTYTCDRCGKSAVDNDRFLKPITVRIGASWSRDGWVDAAIPTRHWCEECIVAMGIMHPGSFGLPKETAPVIPPTLEEVIREIMREEISEALK